MEALAEEDDVSYRVTLAEAEKADALRHVAVLEFSLESKVA